MSVNPRGNGFQVYVRRGSVRFRKILATRHEAELWDRHVPTLIAQGRKVDHAAVRALVLASGRSGSAASFADQASTRKGRSVAPTIGDALKLAHIHVWQHSKAPKTAEINTRVLQRFIAPDTPVHAIDKHVVSEAVAAMIAHGLSNGTINRKLSALRMGLKQALEEGWITAVPRIRQLREPTGRFRVLRKKTNEELALLSTARRLGLNDAADLWVFLIDTGARVREALKLSWVDLLDYATATFWDTKNGRSRTVPLTERVRAMLEARSDREAPFEIEYWQARRAWDHVRSALGMTNDPQWVMHMLRHTCASRLVKGGVPLTHVQEWLGHQSIEQTRRYAHLDPGDLMRAVAVLNEPTRVWGDPPT